MLGLIGFVLINLSATAVASYYGWIGLIEFILAAATLALIFRALKVNFERKRLIKCSSRRLAAP
jgi:hypothetical protein